MIEISYLKEILAKKLSYKRYIHSIRVSETAVKLAKIYNTSISKAQLAGLLHDYAKDLSKSEARKYIKLFNIPIDNVMNYQIDLAHGLIGAELVKHEMGIEDTEILNAIKYHTTGKEKMTVLEKIIYLSDYVEPGRNFPGVEDIRKMSFIDLDKATLMALDNTIKYVISRSNLLHKNSVLARNDLILKINMTITK